MRKRANFKTFLKRNPHCWLLLYFPVYILSFFLIEHNIGGDYWVSYLPLDDKIPFLEIFVIPYYLWYPFLGVTALYFVMADPPVFRHYMYFMMLGMTLSLLICVLFPNGQDLRPDTFERENLFSALVGVIYRVDNNLNVFPSMHVVGSWAVVGAWFHSDKPRRKGLVRGVALTLAVLISASTVLIKQHSILDVIGSVVLCVPLDLLLYGKFRRKNRQHHSDK
ncbi:MAG: phosphatase PAP2 family protein [Oscillospiraceae bacterium]|jgi:membrane-associated phospholipid phosphatase